MRLSMLRDTESIDQQPLPGLRRLGSDDGAALGELLYLAVHGGIDDQGETPKGFRREAEALLRGKYGPVIWTSSFIVVRNGLAACATVVTKWSRDGIPLLAYAPTHPVFLHKTVNCHAIRESIGALHQKGIQKLRLFVEGENTLAMDLYQHLGFSEEERRG